jgi:hypothetical protein
MTTEPTRELRPTRRQRLLWPVLAGLMWLGLALQMVGWTASSATPPVWLLLLYAVAAVAMTLTAVQAWRARIVIDDRGFSVDRGLGRRRYVGWEQVRGARPPRVFSPPAIHVADGADLRFDEFSGPPLSRRQASELVREVEARSDDDHERRHR